MEKLNKLHIQSNKYNEIEKKFKEACLSMAKFTIYLCASDVKGYVCWIQFKNWRIYSQKWKKEFFGFAKQSIQYNLNDFIFVWSKFVSIQRYKYRIGRKINFKRKKSTCRKVSEFHPGEHFEKFHFKNIKQKMKSNFPAFGLFTWK